MIAGFAALAHAASLPIGPALHTPPPGCDNRPTQNQPATDIRTAARRERFEHHHRPPPRPRLGGAGSDHAAGRVRHPAPRHDVAIDILFCRVCHSDLHQARNDRRNTIYPCVPGHEIVGRASAVGSTVNRFKVGDLATVGCLVDSCRRCKSCTQGLEQYCENGMTLTYNSPDRHLGGYTFGGYAEHIVVDQAYTLRVSDKLDPAATAPLPCAGITTCSPLRHRHVGPGRPWASSASVGATWA